MITYKIFKIIDKNTNRFFYFYNTKKLIDDLEKTVLLLFRILFINSSKTVTDSTFISM